MRLFSNDTMGVGSDFKGWYNYLEAPLFTILHQLPELFRATEHRQCIPGTK